MLDKNKTLGQFVWLRLQIYTTPSSRNYSTCLSQTITVRVHQFSSITYNYGINVLNRLQPVSHKFPCNALETALMLVWLMMALSCPLRQDQWAKCSTFLPQLSQVMSNTKLLVKSLWQIASNTRLLVKSLTMRRYYQTLGYLSNHWLWQIL